VPARLTCRSCGRSEPTYDVLARCPAPPDAVFIKPFEASRLLEWLDTTKPDGTPRKLLDVSRLAVLGRRPTIELDEGIRRAYEDYLRSAVREWTMPVLAATSIPSSAAINPV